MGHSVEAKSIVAARRSLLEEVEEVRKNWTRGCMDRAGVAQPFCSGSDVRDLILHLPMQLSDVLLAHEQVMGDVRNLTLGGGAEMALTAIHLLRQGSQLGLLLTSMDRFM